MKKIKFILLITALVCLVGCSGSNDFVYVTVSYELGGINTYTLYVNLRIRNTVVDGLVEMVELGIYDEDSLTIDSYITSSAVVADKTVEITRAAGKDTYVVHDIPYTEGMTQNLVISYTFLDTYGYTRLYSLSIPLYDNGFII